MYLLNEILLFMPLVIYAWYRIRRLIEKRSLKHFWTAVCLLLIAGYPAAESLSHRAVSAWTRPVMLAGYYALPFLLYLVLTVVAADLIVGLARLTKVIPRETIRRPLFRRTRLYSLLLIPAAVVVAGIVNYHGLRVRPYQVEVPRRSSGLRQLRVVFAADFHLGSLTAGGLMDKFVAKVNALEPDIVLIGGDVLEGHRREEGAERSAAPFRELRSKYGVYAVPGNHERYGGNRDEFFERAGMTLLKDAVVKVDDAFYIVGRNDGRSRNRLSVAELLREASDDLPVILLDHRPTDLEAASLSPVDIQLSGHTHHGQLFPLNYVTRDRYELSWGYMKKRRTHVFVTSGVQLWGPPVRTAGYSEILDITVVFRDGD